MEHPGGHHTCPCALQAQAEEQPQVAEEEEEEQVSAGLFSFGTRRIKARAQQEGRTQEVSASQVCVVFVLGCVGWARSQVGNKTVEPTQAVFVRLLAALHSVCFHCQPGASCRHALSACHFVNL